DHDLLDAVDRQALRRAVTVRPVAAGPLRRAGHGVVGLDRLVLGAAGEHSHEALHDERRRGERPRRRLGARVLGHLARPEALASGGVETVELALGAQRVEPAGVEGGRGARTVAADGLDEAGARIAVDPEL